ncbi:hypothetical protein M514_19344 [Trichuris suis]|uniref:Uncharacterized protein n=1 Tax=Trichuris suis TaxID=68888 RepID=A0A085NGC2_9BILA|nr:hypothetical protein M514_19344 [Trichuris suis]
MLPLILRGGRRGLTVWDAARTRRSKEMKNFPSERKIDQMIPVGMTAYHQTLDIGIKKPFKDNMRIEITYYIENKMEGN